MASLGALQSLAAGSGAGLNMGSLASMLRLHLLSDRPHKHIVNILQQTLKQI